MAEELTSQIKTYNTIYPENCIDILAYSQTLYKGGMFMGKYIIPVDMISAFCFDLIVIASISFKDIKEQLLEAGFCANKITHKEEFCPQGNNHNLSQCINTWWIKNSGGIYQSYLENCIEILGRKRLFPNAIALKKAVEKPEVFYDNSLKLNYVIWNSKKIVLSCELVCRKNTRISSVQ